MGHVCTGLHGTQAAGAQRSCGKSVWKGWEVAAPNHNVQSGGTTAAGSHLGVFSYAACLASKSLCFWYEARTSRVGSRKKLPCENWQVLVSCQMIQGPKSPASQATSLGPYPSPIVPGLKFWYLQYFSTARAGPTHLEMTGS